MFDKSLGIVGASAAWALVACGSVAGGDPSFRPPAEGFAGAQAALVTNPNAGASGAMAPGGAGGNAGYAGSWGTGGAQSQGGTLGTGGSQTTGTGGDLGGGGLMETGGVAGTGGTQTNSGTCNFRFDVTTTSYGGRFRPNNVGAIYVVNASGGFVKSLNVWGTKELFNLTDWQQLSGGNTTDAVTGATRSNAGPVSGSWNCTDTNRQPVPDGQYQVCCSFQEDDALPFFGDRKSTRLNSSHGYN